MTDAHLEAYYTAGAHRLATVSLADKDMDDVKIKYIDTPPSSSSTPKGTVLLIHGYPETSYQFRHAIPLLAEAGYRVVTPDYRGAGDSSKPMDPEGYKKTSMAADLRHVVREELDIKDKIHVVGHDIGGMVAHAYAVLYHDEVATVTWGECPLPGTSFYHATKGTMPLFHFNFHNTLDLPEALTAGRERVYIKHFYDRLSYNKAAIGAGDVDFYAGQFAAAGAMRSGFNVYRAFEQDAAENVRIRDRDGKCRVRCLVLNGVYSFLGDAAREEAEEFYEDFEVARVDGSAHWLAEENPRGFVGEILKFVEKK